MFIGETEELAGGVTRDVSLTLHVDLPAFHDVKISYIRLRSLSILTGLAFRTSALETVLVHRTSHSKIREDVQRATW